MDAKQKQNLKDSLIQTTDCVIRDCSEFKEKLDALDLDNFYDRYYNLLDFYETLHISSLEIASSDEDVYKNTKK